MGATAIRGNLSGAVLGSVVGTPISKIGDDAVFGLINRQVANRLSHQVGRGIIAATERSTAISGGEISGRRVVDRCSSGSAVTTDGRGISTV